jgi:hypothetical protein
MKDQGQCNFIHLCRISNNIEEYELEKELHTEKQLEFDFEFDFDESNHNLINQTVYDERYNYITKLKKNNNNDEDTYNYEHEIMIHFEIARYPRSRCDILQCVYLIVDLENIDDYENKIMTQDFLSSSIKFHLGNRITLFEYTILMCIFESKLKGYELIVEDNRIHVPLYVFDFKLPIDNQKILWGFSLCKPDSKSSAVYLDICTKSNLKNLFENISIKGLILDDKYRNTLGLLKYYKNVFLDTKIHKFTQLENYKYKIPIPIWVSDNIKALIFVFYPKYKHLTGIEITGVYFNNLELNEYVTEIKLFNTNIYVVSFSREFNNIENMHNLFKYKDNYITDEGILARAKHIYVDIETSDDMKYYELNVFKISLCPFIMNHGELDFYYKESCVKRERFI